MNHSRESFQLCLRASDLSQVDVGEILNEDIFSVRLSILINLGGGCRYFLSLQMLLSSRGGYVVINDGRAAKFVLRENRALLKRICRRV